MSPPCDREKFRRNSRKKIDFARRSDVVARLGRQRLRQKSSPQNNGWRMGNRGGSSLSSFIFCCIYATDFEWWHFDSRVERWLTSPEDITVLNSYQQFRTLNTRKFILSLCAKLTHKKHRHSYSWVQTRTNVYGRVRALPQCFGPFSIVQTWK